MKRTLCTALAALTLAAGILTAPAQAHTLSPDGVTILPNAETQQFWNTYQTSLHDRGIYEHSADNWSFCPEFRDGLLLIHDGTTASPYGYWDNYVDKNGTLRDLNRGRYVMAFSFSGGLAAVKAQGEMYNTGYNVGYIDTAGNEVIPCTDQWCTFQYGSLPIMAGRFENGRAVVLRSPKLPSYGFNNGVDYPHPTQTFTYDTMNPERWYGIEYAYIDTQGNYLTNWTLTDDINTVVRLPLYDQDGISLYQRVYGLDQTAPEIPVEPGTPGQPEAEATYGQASVQIKGYTIGEDYVGRMLIEVTNTGDAPDQGDLFYLTYSKFIEETDIIDAGSYVPNDLILQIPYEVDAHSAKTLEVPLGFLPVDKVLTGDQMDHGWSYAENVESSRTVLAQAETPEEAQELAAFFKGAHDYGEMALTYQPDAAGVITLAKPMPTLLRAQYLDQKLSAFTSQF